MSRILAIDYGTKRVGLAVTDPLKIIATRLETVHTTEIFQFLDDYFAKEKVETFVVGYATGLKNESTDSTQHIKGFIRKLKKKYPDMGVEFVDERFTSKIASQTLVEAGLKKKTRQNKALIDGVSATLILQTYLNQIK